MARPTYHPSTWWQLTTEDGRAHRIVVRYEQQSGITGCLQGVPLAGLRPRVDGVERCIGCAFAAEGEK